MNSLGCLMVFAPTGGGGYEWMEGYGMVKIVPTAWLFAVYLFFCSWIDWSKAKLCPANPSLSMGFNNGMILQLLTFSENLTDQVRERLNKKLIILVEFFVKISYFSQWDKSVPNGLKHEKKHKMYKTKWLWSTPFPITCYKNGPLSC